MLETPVLVVEYDVASGDTLEQHALWEIGEGYAVVPVLFQHGTGAARAVTPEDSAIRLQHGDRLVVLATAAGLEAIERGDLRISSTSSGSSNCARTPKPCKSWVCLARNLATRWSERATCWPICPNVCRNCSTACRACVPVAC